MKIIYGYGEDWEAFDYKNVVKRFTRTQSGFKISEAKALEINSDTLGFRGRFIMENSVTMVWFFTVQFHGLLKRG